MSFVSYLHLILLISSQTFEVIIAHENFWEQGRSFSAASLSTRALFFPSFVSTCPSPFFYSSLLNSKICWHLSSDLPCFVPSSPSWVRIVDCCFLPSQFFLFRYADLLLLHLLLASCYSLHSVLLHYLPLFGSFFSNSCSW